MDARRRGYRRSISNVKHRRLASTRHGSQPAGYLFTRRRSAHKPHRDADGKSLKQWLYRKKTGEFFVQVEGAAIELQNIFQHGYKPNAGIYPLTYEQAQKWAEHELTAEKWEEIFGDPEDDKTQVSVNLSMTAKVANTLKQNAARAGMTLSAYIVNKCIEKE